MMDDEKAGHIDNASLYITEATEALLKAAPHVGKAELTKEWQMLANMISELTDLEARLVGSITYGQITIRGYK